MLILLKKLYGILYFDFTNQEKGWRTGSTKLEFKYLLSGNLNATYDVYALILHEKKKLSVDYTVIDKAKKKKPTKLKIAKVRHSQRVNEACLSLFGLLLVSYLCTLLWL